MKRFRVLAAGMVIALAAACGERGDDYAASGGITGGAPTAVVTKRGEIAADSWGYTGAAPLRVAAPAGTEVTLPGHTLLADGVRGVVSGTIPTTVSYSTDPTTLPAPAQGSAPGSFVSYVGLYIGTAATATPAALVTVDVGPALAGTTVTAAAYDAASRRWTSAQSAVVSEAGTVTFPATRLSVWGIFRGN